MRLSASDCLLSALDRASLLQVLPKGGIGMEIGVNRGFYSRRILKDAQPSVLHLVDPWPTNRSDEYISTYRVKDNMEDHYQLVRRTFSNEIAAGTVVLHREYSQDCAGRFTDATFDYIYVDGMHSYEACYRDLGLYASKLKPGGILFGHDFSNTESGRRKQFGVVSAVRDFVEQSDFMPVAVTLENAPSYMLTRDEETRDQLIERILRAAPAVMSSFARIADLKQIQIIFGDGPEKVELIHV